jgi:hypothetical protein
VKEGRIKCSNCHEVHGTFGPRPKKGALTHSSILLFPRIA